VELRKKEKRNIAAGEKNAKISRLAGKRKNSERTRTP